jgi:outer membrane lipoprotein SlyB
MKKIIAISAIALMLAGCEHMGPNQTGGTLIGAGAGGLAGAAIGRSPAGVAIGAVAGGALGNVIGYQIDKSKGL